MSLGVSDHATQQLRAAMVQTLLDDGHLTTAAATAAFTAVPRELFAPPGVDLAVLYDSYDVVVTKRGPDGRAMSSISAPSIQAFMIEQARLAPGMRVLEVGSGGVNAAYLAELVGPGGRVVTVDIDPEVTDRAAAGLDAAGYGRRVRVLQADAFHGVADEPPFDVIMVTVQCWDLAAAWLDQLTPRGVIVLPLTIRGGVSRSIAFHRDGHRWISHDAKMCGFVAMQGVGHHPEERIPVGDVVVTFDAGAPDDLELDSRVLTHRSAELWSGVPFPHRTSWEGLYLFLACYLDGFCRLSRPDGGKYPTQTGELPYAAVCAGSIAYLTYRTLPDPDAGIEFGARGFGAEGRQAAQAIIDQVQAWNRTARHLTAWFSYHPKPSDDTASEKGTAVFPRANGLLRVHWPAFADDC